MSSVLSEDQQMLRDTADAFARDELAVSRLRGLRDAGPYGVYAEAREKLAELGVFGALGFWGGLVVSAVLVFALSYLLWWWVEKPALRVDSHYRTVPE